MSAVLDSNQYREPPKAHWLLCLPLDSVVSRIRSYLCERKFIGYIEPFVNNTSSDEHERNIPKAMAHIPVPVPISMARDGF